MRTRETPVTLTDTSPASASTAASTTLLFKGSLFSRAEKLVIDAILIGGTGGTLDVYLQRKTGTNAWLDWVHFPQVAAVTTKRFTAVICAEGAMAANTVFDVGGGTDAAPGVALAVNTSVNCPPGGDVRAVFVAGSSTSAGATQTITITPYTERG
jgi:hypothetical protein